MKFKVEKGTAIYQELELLFDKIKDYNSKTKKFVESLGFEEYGVSLRGRAGGLSCIRTSKKPDGFKTVGKKYDNLFMPKASNKELWKKINELPILSYDEYNKVIGFEAQFQGLSHIRSYRCEKVNDVFLIDVGNADYMPIEGIVEILDSEYKSLKSNS